MIIIYNNYSSYIKQHRGFGQYMNNQAASSFLLDRETKHNKTITNEYQATLKELYAIQIRTQKLMYTVSCLPVPPASPSFSAIIYPTLLSVFPSPSAPLLRSSKLRFLLNFNRKQQFRFFVSYCTFPSPLLLDYCSFISF